MDKQRVVVTGIGAICSVGHDIETIWSNVVEGRPNVTPITSFSTSGLNTHYAAQLVDYDLAEYVDRKTLERLGRYVGLAQVVANQAVSDANIGKEDVHPQRAGVIIGSSSGGLGAQLEAYDTFRDKGVRKLSPYTVSSMLIDTAPGLIAINLGWRGVNMGVVGACASGNYGIGEAYNVITRGDADIMLAGGAEAVLHPFMIAGFERAGAISTYNGDPNRASRPFDAGRQGFVIGEGAAMVVLERLEHALERGVRIYGEILGYAATADAHHLTSPHEHGTGAAAAIQLALAKGCVAAGEVDYINAHGSSTKLNDVTETQSIKRAFGEQAYDIPVSSTKSVTGHILGGAGALEAIFCLLAMRDGVIPPTINYEDLDPTCDLDYVPNEARTKKVDVAVSNAFGFGGHNSTLVLGAYKNGRRNGNGHYRTVAQLYADGILA